VTRVLITAGPTHEAIDTVRYIGNRSSGRMGMAIAEAARDAGWAVTLLLGPVCARPPEGVHVERFTTTDDLARLLDRHFPACDVLVMAAAVADFRPAEKTTGKLPRTESVSLSLEATPDLVAACAKLRTSQRIVGFALEEERNLAERACEKLRSKNLDAIVGNPLKTLDSSNITAKVFASDGSVHRPPTLAPMDKEAFARWLVAWMGERWA
jgi:phosphopantothenoylcysteine decarboxylase/phosphopantothenate--cysteine ligase